MNFQNVQHQTLELLKKEKSIKQNTPKEMIYKWRSIFNQSSWDGVINMGKKIEEDQQGWHWYKNLIIPTIKVQIIELSKNNQQSQSYNSAQTLVSVMAFKKINNHTVLPVILSGNQTQYINQGKCIFKGLKFEETCFMSKSSFFFLTLVFYDSEQIYSIQISPKMQIEARKKYWQDRQGQIEIFDPFQPKLLSIEHREGKPNNQVLQKIRGSVYEKILNYFSNITIRHKIRHPLFLFLKFPYAIRIYTNNNFISPDLSDKNKMIEIQKQFYQTFKQENLDRSKEQKPIIVQLNKVEQKLQLEIIQKNINRYLVGLECSSISYIQDPNEEMPLNFTEFEYNESLVDSYIQAYGQIINIQFQAQMGAKKENSDADENSSNQNLEEDLKKESGEIQFQEKQQNQIDNLNIVIDVQKYIQKQRSQNPDRNYLKIKLHYGNYFLNQKLPNNKILESISSPFINNLNNEEYIRKMRKITKSTQNDENEVKDDNILLNDKQSTLSNQNFEFCNNNNYNQSQQQNLFLQQQIKLQIQNETNFIPQMIQPPNICNNNFYTNNFNPHNPYNQFPNQQQNFYQINPNNFNINHNNPYPNYSNYNSNIPYNQANNQYQTIPIDNYSSKIMVQQPNNFLNNQIIFQNNPNQIFYPYNQNPFQNGQVQGQIY